ncbi:MAG: hypothetical protein E6H06_11530 [Bacteroidetes bacterium]|nr:MAG: hypothetical protein E6H06_11530 [Bacteroidota bacterium]
MSKTNLQRQEEPASASSSDRSEFGCYRLQPCPACSSRQVLLQIVETGFITNREEEDYLNSKDGQQEIAKCVTDAVKNYTSWLEKTSGQNSNTQNNPVPSPANTDAFLNMIETKEKNGF